MTDAQAAEIYKVAAITVKKWKASGKRVNLPAPVQYPDRMPAWWASMIQAGEFVRDCPEGVQQAAFRVTAAMGDPDDDEYPVSGAPDPEMSALLAAIETGEGFGYGDGVKVAERNVQVTDLLLMRALRSGDEKKLGPLQRRLNEAQDNLRALLRDRGRIQADAAETLPKTEVRAAMMEIHSNIQRQFRQRLRHAFDLASDHLENRGKWNTFCDDLVDQICVALTATKFAAPD